MSKDMLGLVVRKLVDVLPFYLGVVLDLLERLASKNSKERAKWYRRLRFMLRQETTWGVELLPEFTTDGRSGSQLISAIREKGYDIDWGLAEKLIRSPVFETSRAIIYWPVVLRGDQIPDSERTDQRIKEIAEARHWVTPPAEVGAYLAEMLTADLIKAMGFEALVVMHESFAIPSDGGPAGLLGVSISTGILDLATFITRPGEPWDDGFGFVFLEPVK